HALAHLALGLGIDWQREVGMGLDVDEARRHGKTARVDDLGGRVVDARPDGGNAAVADRDIDGLARGSRAVEEKTAADQDVMARAQVATGPLSSTPLPSGLLLGGKLRPCVLRRGSALPPGYAPIPLFSGSLRLWSPSAFTPISANDGPPPAVETETIDRRGRGERADAIADARPLETAFFQDPARSRVAPPRAARHHVVTEVVKG